MDIKELDCFRQYLDTDKIAKKNIYPFVWLSGSNTLVSPIAYYKNEIVLQWNGERNIYRKWIERTVKKFDNILKDSYFDKGDGSCPPAIVFELKNCLETK